MDKKVVLITVASSGMGKESALQLIREGHIVYGAARRIGKMEDLVKAGGHAIKMDVTEEGWSDCFRLELKQFNIDVVVIETEFMSVLIEPFKKRSENGAYRELANKFIRASEKKPMAVSPSSVIAKIVSKAINAKKPKTRNVAGKMAKPLMFIRKWFGNKVYDRSIMSQMG